MFAVPGAEAVDADRQCLAKGVEPIGVRGVSVRRVRGGGTVRAADIELCDMRDPVFGH